MSDIIPGCWITSPTYGRVVCTINNPGSHHIYYRYEATSGDGFQSTLWVLDGDVHSKLTYLAPPDEISLKVLELTGPYGCGVEIEDDPDWIEQSEPYVIEG
jgi:hypothetical protein